MSKGTRIREYRERALLSQVELAEKIGVSKQTMYKYENDVITNIPSDKIEAIAKATGAKPEMIMGWDTVVDKVEIHSTLNQEEYTIITNYRAADLGTKAAVRKLLDVHDETVVSVASSKPVPDAAPHLMPIAAHAKDGATPEELQEDVELLEKFAESKKEDVD